jgi:hypothetical protein
MDLLGLRSMVRNNIFDTSSTAAYGDPALNDYINVAMNHMANYADTHQQGLFVASGTATVTAAMPYVTVQFYTTGFALAATARFRRLLTVRRSDYPVSGAVTELNVAPVGEWAKHKTDAANPTPYVCVDAASLRVVSPASFTIVMDYIQSLPDMVDDNDTPGVSNGTGTANLLPTEYHPLIATYASALVMAADNCESNWPSIFAEQLAELEKTLVRT